MEKGLNPWRFCSQSGVEQKFDFFRNILGILCYEVMELASKVGAGFSFDSEPVHYDL